jgi:hypothetical protein
MIEWTCGCRVDMFHLNAQSYIYGDISFVENYSTMTFDVDTFITSALCGVFRKVDRPDGINVNEAIEMIQGVKRIATGLKKYMDKTRLLTDDRKHCDKRVQQCVNALQCYNESVDIDEIDKKYKLLRNQMNRNMVENSPVIQSLSFNIHLTIDISYWYVQRYILAKLYPDSKYSMRGSDFSWIDSEENTPMASIIIDSYMIDEERFVPLPPVTTLESAEISQLQYYVLQIEGMCLELPADIQQTVSSARRNVNYLINPNTSVVCEFNEASGTIRCNGAKSLVELALDCGGINIELESAFWIHCMLPYEFAEWSMVFDNDFNSYLYEELRRFPEMDQCIIVKVETVIMHPVYKRRFQQ